jgi:cytoskeletal protein RodZ
MTDNSRRLTCFDDIAARLPSKFAPPGQVKQSQPMTIPPVSTAKINDDNFGLKTDPAKQRAEREAKQRAKDIAQQKAAEQASNKDRYGLKAKAPDKALRRAFKVVSTKTDRYDKLVFTFANGHVWQQTDNRTRRSFTGDVSIEEGLLGSFMLYKKGKKSGIRVKRIK